MISTILLIDLRNALRGRYAVVPAPNRGNPRLFLKG